MLRTSLAQISGNHVRRTELTPYQRGVIIGAHSADASPGRISKLTNLPDFIVRITLKKAAEREDDQSRSRSDRPTMLFARDTRHLIRIARVNSRISYKELKIQAELACSRIIIYRALKSYELIN